MGLDFCISNDCATYVQVSCHCPPQLSLRWHRTHLPIEPCETFHYGFEGVSPGLFFGYNFLLRTLHRVFLRKCESVQNFIGPVSKTRPRQLTRVDSRLPPVQPQSHPSPKALQLQQGRKAAANFG